MRFENPVPLSEIAALIEARVVGDSTAFATGINEIHQVENGDLVFVDHPKYYDTSIHSAASFIIINAEHEVPEGKALLIVEEPFEAYLKIVSSFRPFQPSMDAVSATAKTGAGTVVMPNVYLGNYVTIGANCVIYPNVTIMDYCTIGDNVIIQSGTVIGSDAFYYNKKTNRQAHYKKMTSCGTVVIEADVEIGAGCTIDRGVTGVTRIGAGTKMDNLVHIGHDTLVGKNCLFAAQVGIAGASVIEDEVILWGQVGVSKTLTIGRGAVINAQSGVRSSLKGGASYFGSPAVPAREKMKELVWIKRIPQIWERLNKS
ncbi:UDP-3-O-(3-hydroxymyristoyl)glucosamine N-acyltransferase [Niabella drilacis]|uniref:UDP-3-O-[3-hydroxymyristoyl] glucosamine N-acyltransferase n=1 Tax=Niabella drilacis (strain DSM 25811 / CCM 8410 / CCUG 62505 / LMG 26954 / E90) TaxID=1285928 RepID=A0A1G6N7Y1_NIADE|nr:UDP-3-O-(3-hydroxymyristoyl)glucosamine N-acyltransferase [Niabella drilacis]SDC63939.1 UDP-3-O-[3-hydroxymyristoyl] glucosamine N-acyltransferase [Niabella drilacis]